MDDSLAGGTKSPAAISDDLDLWEWKDHPPAAGQEFGLAANDPVTKMPGQNQEIVWLHRTCLSFRNDRNTRTGRERTELVFVDLGNAGDEIGTDAAELQQNVAFGGGAIAHDFPAVCHEDFQQA